MTEALQQTAPNPSDAPIDARLPILDAMTGQSHNITGEVITAPNGSFEQSRQLRDMCALTSDGQFLVSVSHAHDPAVLALAERARLLGHKVDTPFIRVEMGTLRALYERADAETGRSTDTNESQRRVIRLITEAVEAGSSDIHVVAEPTHAHVEFRIDGLKHKHVEMRPEEAMQLCGTVHAMSDDSDTAHTELERQQARIDSTKYDLPRTVGQIRVQWNPLGFGGRFMVMRLNDRDESNASTDISALGYEPEELAQLNMMRAQPSGLFVIAGPMNSGKSRTLSRVLRHIIKERRGTWSVQTVEDPIENIIPGAQQMPVVASNDPAERARKYSDAIRGALRSDFNALMIGEIRDAEAAQLATEGAMIGRQVWTSLHANDAISIIFRLKDLGVEAFKLYDPTILRGLIAQRLLPRLCPHCKVDAEASAHDGFSDPTKVARAAALLADVGHKDTPIYGAGPGCQHCRDTGYSGRVAVAETVQPDDRLMDLVREDHKSEARRHWLENLGGKTMLTNAVLKLTEGVVGPEEVEQNVGVLLADPSMQSFFARRQGEQK
ncbi:GspE/PulE family protein [Rhodovibrio sodomensis]|nr:ATPase, T2SS/T4P/T4SS family [Rhodovibrio sodomensis]